MTPSPTLIELAERCERLTGPCREMDYLICEAVHPLLARDGYQRTEGDSGYYSATPSIPGGEKIGPASDYTGSLDAAMTLAVKGYHILAIHEQPAAWIVRIGSRSNDREPTVDVECDHLESALCSAWLQVRARAALESSHG